MISENLNWFVSSYVFLAAAAFFAAIDSLVVSSILVGLSVLFRSMANVPLAPAIQLIQEMPKWKWFSVVYFFTLLAFILKNIDIDFYNKVNPIISVFTIMFPFIVPHLICEYRSYKKLKHKYK
jgi:hypothetical protein